MPVAEMLPDLASGKIDFIRKIDLNYDKFNNVYLFKNKIRTLTFFYLTIIVFAGLLQGCFVDGHKVAGMCFFFYFYLNYSFKKIRINKNK